MSATTSTTPDPFAIFDNLRKLFKQCGTLIADGNRSGDMILELRMALQLFKEDRLSGLREESELRHRDWEKIAKIEDHHLRFAITMANHGEWHSFRRGFPHLFSERHIENPGVGIPASEIRESLAKHGLETWSQPAQEKFRDNPNFEWQDAVSWFPIPIFTVWANEERFAPAPEEVREQLIGQITQPGMRFRYDGKELIVAYIGASARYGEPFSIDDTIDYLGSAPTGAIDFDH